MASNSHIAQARLAACGRDCANDYVGWRESEILAVRAAPDLERTLDAGLLLRANEDGRVASYVMSTERPVGPFGDVVIVAGWNLQDFGKRGRPFLYSHNRDRMDFPIGSMRSVSKQGTLSDGSPALVGDGVFAPEGLSALADQAWALTRARVLRGGSVGFRVLESRSPTAAELQSIKGLTKTSFIAERARLIEFSAVPVGMDPDAVVVGFPGPGTRSGDEFEAVSDEWISDSALSELLDEVVTGGHEFPDEEGSARETITLTRSAESAVRTAARTLADAWDTLLETYGIDEDTDDPEGTADDIGGLLLAMYGTSDDDGIDDEGEVNVYDALFEDHE